MTEAPARPRSRSARKQDGDGWYRISNSADGPAQILIYSEVGFWGVTAEDFIRDLSAIRGPVEVRINSGGGDPFEAYAIYGALTARTGVTTVVDSLAASAASVIAMAGEQRLMAKYAQMMIHDAWAAPAGNAADLRHMADRLEMTSEQIAGVYADAAGGSPDDWRDQMRAETWYTPEQALEAGLITAILPAGRATAPAPALEPAGASAGEPGIRAAAQPWDPDGDGDDDSTPEGDTDHSHWTADGKQKKPVPGKPMPGQPPASASREGVSAAAGSRHEPIDGSHTHPHPAYGSQGGDAMHSHSHSHDGDAAHSHSHASSQDSATGALCAHFGWTQDQAEALSEEERATLLATLHGHGHGPLAADVDTSAWDGNAAMSGCSGASDYRAICAGEHTTGSPDERQHWALPHHKSPGAAPNAAGVRAAESRIGQTQDLKNKQAAQAHLDAHMKVISPEQDSAGRQEHSQSAASAPAAASRKEPTLTIPRPDGRGSQPSQAGVPVSPGLASPVSRIGLTAPPQASHPARPAVDPEGQSHSTGPRKESAVTTTTTMSIEDRAARRGEIEARLTAIGTEHGDAVLGEETQAEWDTLSAELDEHQGVLASHEQAVTARRERVAAIAARQEGERVTAAGYTADDAAAIVNGAGDGSSGHVPPAYRGPQNRASAALATSRTDDRIYDVLSLRSQVVNQEDFAARARDNALRVVERGTFPGSQSRERAQHVVERLLNSVDDEDATLARRVMVTGSPLYMRAWSKMVARRGPAGLTPEESKALELGRISAALGTGGADGGYAVPFQLDASVILVSDGAINAIRQVSRVETIVGKEFDLVTSQGVTVTRSAEASPMPDNSPTLEQPTIKAERLTGFIPFSMEIEQDWPAMQNQMMMLIADAKDVEESAAFTNGTGVAPDAGGIITTLASSSHVAGTGGAGVLSTDDLYGLEDAMAPRFRSRAVWMASKTGFNAYRKLFVQDASAAGDEWVRPSGGTPAELIGYSAYEDSDMTTTHATGDKPIILGDFGRGFLIVDRLGMSSEIAPILFDPETGRPTGQRGLVLFWRNNSRVLVDNAFRLLVVG